MKSGPAPGQLAVVGPPDEALPASSPPAPPAASQRSTQSALDSLTPAIADHELLRVIGRGSYGEVWLARHTRLGTLRAVKIVSRDNFHDARPFQREFDGIRRYEPISRAHPNLVNILHVGGTDECFYYVMELADDAVAADVSLRADSPEARHGLGERGKLVGGCAGRQEDNSGSPAYLPTCSPAAYMPKTLRQELKQHGSLPADRCLEIARSLAAALAHLHANDLVHRDVKPSNIIFVGGVPKLADIGLVAGVDDARSFVGTEGYIPPEGPGTPSADCYSLGKLLYELSTGHDRNAWPEPPAGLATRPDRERLLELNAILHRACAPDPRQRYVNAEAMLAEIELLQGGQSIKRKRAVDRSLGVFKKAVLVAIVLAAIVGGTRFVSNALHPGESVPKPSSSDEATELFYRGWYTYQKKTGPNIKLAIALFEEALAKDPKYATAHAALASSYCWSLADLRPNPAKAKKHAEIALDLDDKLAEAHMALACIKWKEEWDLPGSLKEFRRAIELAPHDASVHEWYGTYLRSIGRVNESINEFKEAERWDWASLSIPVHLAGAYSVNHQDELAVKEYKKVISKETNAPSFAYIGLAGFYEDRGDFPSAIEFNERWHRLNGEDEESVRQKYEALGEAFRRGGARGYWEKQLEWAKAEDEHYTQARLYARLGKKEKAFELLETSFAEHDGLLLVALKTDPALESLRSDPRYAKLLQELKLN